MAASSMSLNVMVRLKDHLSGPLGRLKSSLGGIGSAARKIGLVSAAIAGISFMGPMQEAAAYNQQLLDIAVTSGLVGEAAHKFARQTGDEYKQLALDVGQTSENIAAGAGQMIAAGIDTGVIDRNIAKIGRTATAASAEFSDMSAVTISLLQTLSVPETELEGALAGLVVAGKMGKFELNAMAKYFPQLTGQMAKFGIVGREASDQLAAMLQVAHMGTADPAQAANNLNNFLSKALAPITQKNFMKAGIDIEAVMMDAAAKGINPVEAMIQKITKVTGVSGDMIAGFMDKAKANGLEGAEALDFVKSQLEAIGGAGKLGELFGDQQVLDFLIPMLGNIDEYKRIKAEVANATSGLIDDDFQTKMAGDAVQLQMFKEVWKQASDEIGSAFNSWLPAVNKHLTAAIKWFRAFDKETGGAARKALSFAAAGVAVLASIGALGVVLPVVAAGFSLFTAPLMSIGRLGISAFGWALRLGPLFAGMGGVIMPVISVIGSALAALVSPIGLVVAAVAGLALAIYNYWEPISNFVSGFASVIGGALGNLFSSIAGWAGQKLLDFTEMLGLDPAEVTGAVSSVWAAITGFGDDVVSFFKGLPAQIGGWFKDLFTMNDYSDEEEAGFKAAGEQMGQQMVDAVKSKINEWIDWLGGLAKRAGDAIGSINIGDYISWPKLPAWLGGSGGSQTTGDEEKPASTGGGSATAGGEKAAAVVPAAPVGSGGQQKLALNGNVGVKVSVEGPGRVSAVNSDNPMLKPDGGKTVGRA